MKVTVRCPGCGGVVAVNLKLSQRADGDTILATALQIHIESCPAPAPRTAT